MKERELRKYEADIKNSDGESSIYIFASTENLSRKKADKVFREMKLLKEKFKNIMAD